MPEDQAETATANEEQTVDATEALDASAGTENTERQETKEENRVPQSRLTEVADEKNKALERAAELEARVKELEAGATKAEETAQADETADTPPSNLSREEQVEWYVRRFAGKMIEEDLGMSLKEAKAVLSAVPPVAKDHETRRWIDLCGQHQLDPKNTDLQEYVRGQALMSDGNMDVGGVFKKAQRIFGKSEATVKETETGGNGKTEASATVENDGVSGVMTGEKVFYRTKADAVEGARKGIQQSPATLVEILGEFDKSRPKTGG